MNYSTAVMLINPKIRAIKTVYQPDTVKADGTTVKGPRVMFKTLDTEIKKGDLVVVPTTTRHGMTVVLVDEVDVEVDFDSEVQVNWVLDKLSLSAYNNIAVEENKWIETLKASEKRSKREEIKKKMLEMYKDDGIDALPIANMGDPAAPAAIENKT